MSATEYDIAEQYNELLKRNEIRTQQLINRALERSLNRIIRRIRAHIAIGKTGTVNRNLTILMELNQLVPVIAPNKITEYELLYRKLLEQSSRYGMTVAEDLTVQMRPEAPQLSATVPLEAVEAAARQANGFLSTHGRQFATKSAELIASGIAEGRPTNAMIQDLRSELGVVKSRAATITRTESLRAYNEASNAYFTQQGVTHVLFYATADDRACPICTGRAGKVYKKSEIHPPLHPNCRCTVTPWDLDLSAMDSGYAATGQRHRREVGKASSNPLSDDLTKAVFEARTPSPVT